MTKKSQDIIMKSAANLQRGWETVGGKLTLTEDELIFNPHKLNIQRAEKRVLLSKVASVTECWTKFLNKFPVANNSLSIVTDDGDEYRFVLSKRKRWAKEINRLTK